MSRTHAKEVVTLPAAGGRGVAVLGPCYNEEPTVARVVARFQPELPEARVYVFDDNSTDRAVEEAGRAGAVVFTQRRQGKGSVVQSMFRQVDADSYVMVDGDSQEFEDHARALTDGLRHSRAHAGEERNGGGAGR